MSNMPATEIRCFTTYSGIKLPLKLVSPLTDEELQNRNTYHRAYYSNTDQMIACQKVVYGEIEQEHRYDYHDNGMLKRAEIKTGDEVKVIHFDDEGMPVRD